MKGEVLERCFVNLINDAANQSGLSIREFACKVFLPAGGTDKEMEAAVKKWQGIRLGQKGKPQRVSIGDASELATAIGENVGKLLIKAEVMVEQGWNLDQDMARQESNKKPGRPATYKKSTCCEHAPAISSTDVGAADQG